MGKEVAIAGVIKVAVKSCLNYQGTGCFETAVTVIFELLRIGICT